MGHDYGFKTESRVSILALQGRVVVPYAGYSTHVDLIQHRANIGTVKLWYDKPRKQFYLLVSLEIDVPDPMPETHTSVVGVDVGIRYLAVASNTKGRASFHSSKRIVPKADHDARLRKRLQQKGTRSATRRLVAISGRERRLKADANHRVSKSIVKQYPHSLIGLENLTDIRDRTRRKRSKRTSTKQRKANARTSKWAFVELHNMLAYKAARAGSMAIKVDAHYTSQACPMCGHTAKANRPGQGLVFVCQVCHYTLHTDLVGARNITMRTLFVRQDWTETGILSRCPDASDREAKAERLSRYSELRWSPDASPSALARVLDYKLAEWTWEITSRGALRPLILLQKFTQTAVTEPTPSTR